MKKRKILNLLMVLTIILTIGCGIMAVGSVKGWFQTSKMNSKSDDDITVEHENACLNVFNKSGIIFVERNGISYEIEEGDQLRLNDKIYTKRGSNAVLRDENDNQISLNEDTTVKIHEIDQLSVELLNGELLVCLTESDDTFNIKTSQMIMNTHSSIFGVTSYAASTSVYLYAGEANFDDTDSTKKALLKEGETVSYVENIDGKIKEEIYQIPVEALSEYQITSLLEYKEDKEICFTTVQLEHVIDVRAQEKEQALQAQLLLTEQAKKQLDEEQKLYNQKVQDAEKNAQSGTSGQVTIVNGSSNHDRTNHSTDTTENYGYCTIEIRCDTILDNLGSLTAGKESFVPSNGKILAPSVVEFTEGETVFDVLKRACSRAGIQLEYSWTPLYNSYYIEGIHNLYEFDCGNESGWMYKVNGWFPNYGCSSYDLSDGDTIVWCYTCNGLGADVGGSAH